MVVPRISPLCLFTLCVLFSFYTLFNRTGTGRRVSFGYSGALAPARRGLCDRVVSSPGAFPAITAATAEGLRHMISEDYKIWQREAREHNQ